MHSCLLFRFYFPVLFICIYVVLGFYVLKTELANCWQFSLGFTCHLKTQPQPWFISIKISYFRIIKKAEKEFDLNFHKKNFLALLYWFPIRLNSLNTIFKKKKNWSIFFLYIKKKGIINELVYNNPKICAEHRKNNNNIKNDWNCIE